MDFSSVVKRNSSKLLRPKSVIFCSLHFEIAKKGNLLLIVVDVQTHFFPELLLLISFIFISVDFLLLEEDSLPEKVLTFFLVSVYRLSEMPKILQLLPHSGFQTQILPLLQLLFIPKSSGTAVVSCFRLCYVRKHFFFQHVLIKPETT